MEEGNAIRLERNGKLSASELDACSKCPARFNRTKDLIEEKSSASAKRGGKIHKALENSSFEGLSNSDLRTVDILMNKESSLVEKFELEGAEVYREKRFWMADEVSAKCDVIYYTPLISLLIDYKTGWIKHPEEEHELQIDCQALCASCELESEAYVSALITPIGHYYKVYGRDELLEAENKIVTICNESYQGGDASPNKLSCKFCLAKKTCEEYKKHVDIHGELR